MKYPKLVFAIAILFLTTGIYSCIDQGVAKTTSEPNISTEVTSKLVVELDETGIEIQPTMYGIFFEDINFSADGGLYAELIKNRSFEFPDAKMGWRQPNSSRPSLNGDSGFAKITNYVSPNGGNKKYSHTV